MLTSSHVFVVLNAFFAQSLQLYVPFSPVITMNSVNPGFGFSGLRTGIPANESEEVYTNV